MADPVTIAMVGAAAGAATNKKDPLKGALLGATIGGIGGAVAPGLIGAGTTAASGAAGAAGVTSGLPAATGGLLGSTAPMMSGGGSPVAAALAQQGLAGPPLMSAMPAAPSALSRLATPQALMAGAQLAGSLTPRQAQTAPMPVTQARPISMAFEPTQLVQSPVVQIPGVPRFNDIMQTQVMGRGRNEELMNYFPLFGGR